ncbi:MAG: TorF family putative porin [Pseudobdellovibrionaceae bacterium]
MKKILLGLCALTLSSPAFADGSTPLLGGDLTGNVALTTEYVFRGITQSNEEPTVQGGLDWSEASTGLYLGTWGSGVDFNDATTEFDFYGGVSGNIDGITWDLGAIYYFYPGADDSLNYDFWELAAAAGYDFDVMSASVSINYSPDYFASSGDSYYAALNAEAPLPYDLKLTGSVAKQWIEDNTAFGVGKDYMDWSLGLGYSFEGFDVSLKYIDTNLDEPSECADGCAERVVFTVSRSF